MPLTEEQVTQIQNQIQLAATGAGPLVALLGPQAVAGLVIGTVVAKQMPGLVAIVQRWVSGAEPTPEERATVAQQLAVLSDPNLP